MEGSVGRKLAVEAASIALVFVAFELWQAFRDPDSWVRLALDEATERGRDQYRAAFEQARAAYEMRSDLDLLLKGELA